MIHVGFTGTREGMTDEQREGVCLQLIDLLARSLLTLHHGDCIGADAQAHALARRLGIVVEKHPARHVHPALVAGCEMRPGEVTHDRLPPLERNCEIVAACSVLIAAPREMLEQPQGGTWYTVRRARMANRHRAIVFPDGSVDLT